MNLSVLKASSCSCLFVFSPACLFVFHLFFSFSPACLFFTCFCLLVFHWLFCLLVFNLLLVACFSPVSVCLSLTCLFVYYCLTCVWLLVFHLLACLFLFNLFVYLLVFNLLLVACCSPDCMFV